MAHSLQERFHTKESINRMSVIDLFKPQKEKFALPPLPTTSEKIKVLLEKLIKLEEKGNRHLQFILTVINNSKEKDDKTLQEEVINAGNLKHQLIIEIQEVLVNAEQETIELIKNIRDIISSEELNTSNRLKFLKNILLRPEQIKRKITLQKKRASKSLPNEVNKIIGAIEFKSMIKLNYETLANVTKISENRLRKLFKQSEFVLTLSGQMKRKCNSARNADNKEFWTQWYKDSIGMVAAISEKARSKEKSYHDMSRFPQTED